MDISSGTKEKLLEEISELKKKIQKLVESESQHKPQEMELHTSELKFRQIAEDMPALICTFLSDSTLTYVNAAYCKLFSKRQEELVGQKFLDFLPDEATRENVRRQYMSLTPENPIRTYEHEVIVSDGTGKFHWHRWTDRAFFNDNGEISHFQSIGQDITESKLAEDELRVKDFAIASSINAIATADLEGNLNYVNPAFLKMWGYDSPSEVLGKPVVEFWKMGKKAAEVMDAVRKKRGWIGELVAQRKDGTLFDVHVASSMVVDDARRPVCVQASFEDITKRKLAEDALIESEASLAEAQRIARIGSWDWDMISNTVKWSKEMYRVFGISPEAFDSKPESLLKVIHPEDVELFTNTMKSNLKKGNPTSLEFRVIHKSGSIHHIFAAGRVEFNKDGRPIRNIGTAQDITERKHAEEALQDAHWRLESIIEGTNIGTWEWNVQTGETVFSDVWAQIIGYTLDELKPISIKTWEKYSHPDDLKQSGELLERHFAGDLPYYDYDCRMMHKDGHWVWVQDRGRVITRTAEGKPLLMFGTHTNITDRKQSEEALREKHKRLELALLGGGLGMWDWHPQTGAVVYSDLWALMLEYRPDEVEPTVEFFKQHIHPDDLPAVLDRLTGHVEGHMPVYMSEHRLRTKSGGWLWVLDHGIAVESDKNGHAVRVVGVIADITNRKQAERNLMLIQSSIEASSDALYWITPDSRIVNVNESACRLLGYTREELLQLCVPDIDTEYNAEIWKQHFPELRKKRSLKFSSTHRAKDGRLIPVEIVANYIQFDNEEFNCAFVRDRANR